MGEVIDLPVWTKVPLDPDTVLKGAIGKLDQVLIIGLDKNGEVWSSTSSPDTTNWVYLCQQFQHKLFNGDFG